MRRTASQAALGVTGPTTLPRRCERSRTSWEFKTLLDSGILQDRSIELDLSVGAFAAQLISRVVIACVGSACDFGNRIHRGWQRGELQAPSSDRAEARAHCDAGYHGIHHA